MKILGSILEAIGNTPLVRLNQVTKGINASVLVKCEYLNPSGSIKDRIALRMIEEAEKAGNTPAVSLRKSQTKSNNQVSEASRETRTNRSNPPWSLFPKEGNPTLPLFKRGI